MQSLFALVSLLDSRINLAVTTGEGNVNGFGLEFFIETPADEIPDSVDDIKRSWQFQLLYTVSQLAAGANLHHCSESLQQKLDMSIRF